MNGGVNLYIDEKLCMACRPCLAGKACKVKAFVNLDPDEPPFLDLSCCYDCRLCILACPYDAVLSGNGQQVLQE